MKTFKLKIIPLQIIFYLVLTVLPPGTFGQKPLIDTSAMNEWISLASQAKLSDNAKYACYEIENQPLGKRTSVITATDAKWKKEFIGLPVSSINFSANNQYAIYADTENGVFSQKLGSTEEPRQINKEAKSYQVVNIIGREYLVLNFPAKQKKIILREFATGIEKTYEDVISYFFSPDGSRLALSTSDGSTPSTILTLIDFANNSKKKIWEGDNAPSISFDKKGEQFVFVTGTIINYFKIGMSETQELIDISMAGFKGAFKPALGWSNSFSDDGDRLFFDVKKEYPKASKDAVMVDVWSYTDTELQTIQQKGQLSKLANESFRCVVNLPTKKVIQLTGEGESVFGSFHNRRHVLVERRKGIAFESHWNSAARNDIYLVSLETGEREHIIHDLGPSPEVHISPSEKFVFFYDAKQKNFFCYEISTKTLRNISKQIQTYWWSTAGNNHSMAARPTQFNCGISGWLADDRFVLINTQNDIWKVDPLGEQRAVKLTNGEETNTVFRAMGSYSRSTDVYSESDDILLFSFNTRNKNAGFFNLKIDGKPQLSKLTDGAFCFNQVYPFGFPPMVVKAKNRKGWLLRRAQNQQSTNLYYTNDFKNFQQLSSIYPEKKYNWFTAELHSVHLPGGDFTQGILYKPENFDSSRQYPVVIYFYENQTEQLNNFRDPRWVGGVISIPHFVSNGYLVFTPDIAFRGDKPGDCALRTLEACAFYLEKLSFVNGRKIGINGHSFGGYENNYVITHSKRFAAAITGAGESNFISSSGTISKARSSLGYSDDPIYYCLETPFWESLDKYLAASPIYSAHHVTTPLLIFHNKEDGAVPFEQGMELFLALRRMGKKTWLLQYDGEDHANFIKRNQYDLEIRFKQFFDHYLKDMPAPKWMTRGIPAKLKGIESGLEYDTENSTPGIGLNLK